MKDPETWNETDLLELISKKAEEHSQLDFKRAESLENTDQRKNEISKDVSAFANSGGGIIVYGIEESSDIPHFAMGLSPIDATKVSKEWLEHVINGRIRPRIHGVKINPVKLPTKGADKLAYVISIPESSTAHQASDRKYYKRFNFESVPMEDYEIRLVMNRSSRPSYVAKLEAQRIRTTGDRTYFQSRVCVENTSEMVGHEVSLILLVPSEFAGGADGKEIVRDAVPYVRMSMTFEESSHSRRSVIPLLAPYTPHWVDFHKEMSFSTKFPPAKRFTAFVYGFDQFGLALEVAFHVYMPKLNVEPVQENSGPRRTPWVFEGFGLA